MLLVNPKLRLEEWTCYTRLIPASSSLLAVDIFVNSLNEEEKMWLLFSFFIFNFFCMLDTNTLPLHICINIFRYCLIACSIVTCLSSLETKMFLETLPKILEGLLLALFVREIKQLEFYRKAVTGVSICDFEMVIQSHAIMIHCWKILKFILKNLLILFQVVNTTVIIVIFHTCLLQKSS